jgi:DNA repair exonuclease SbcCD nuclease subunit
MPRPANEITLIHSSDLHVDNGFTARSHDGDGTRGLAAVLATARAAEADLVLLAGDVFEHVRLPMDLLDRTRELLAKAGRPVVLLPGNHDPALADGVYHRGGFLDLANVHVIGITHAGAVPFAEWDLEVWGHAHMDYANMAPLKNPRPRGARLQIAAAHGHYEPVPDPAKAHHPSWLISDADIAATDADYVALGHWNRWAEVGDGTVPAFYSGSPEHAGTVNLVRLGGRAGLSVERLAVIWDPV